MNIFNSYRYSGGVPLTDNLKHGWSMRQINPSILNCMRVKRSSDNQEVDVPFLNGEIDVNFLTSFAGSSTVNVVCWYDQGYKGSDGDLMPNTDDGGYIVNNGSLLQTNGKPHVDFDFSTASGLVSRVDSGVGMPGKWHDIAVMNFQFTNQSALRSRLTSGFTAFGSAGRSYRRNATSVSFGFTAIQRQQILIATTGDTTNTSIRLINNGVDEGTLTGLNRTGSWNGRGFLWGTGRMKLQEHLIWDFDADSVSSNILQEKVDDANNFWGTF